MQGQDLFPYADLWNLLSDHFSLSINLSALQTKTNVLADSAQKNQFFLKVFAS